MQIQGFTFTGDQFLDGLRLTFAGLVVMANGLSEHGEGYYRAGIDLLGNLPGRESSDARAAADVQSALGLIAEALRNRELDIEMERRKL